MAGIEWSGIEEKFLVEHPELSAREIANYVNRTPNSVRQKRMKMRGDLSAGIVEKEEDVRLTRLGVISDLLEKSGIDPEDVGKVERIRLNEWQGMIKNNAGLPEIVDMKAASILLSPKWADGPKWPVVQPSPPIRVYPMIPPSKQRSDGMEVAVGLPDCQIGYFRNKLGELQPTHDEAALDVALKVMRVASPDRVILFGDNLDLPELSKYRKEPTFQITTQASIDRATKLLADIRANVPRSCQIDWIEGNHEIRLPNYIKDNAAAAFGLRKGQSPDDWPVLSIPMLCRLDELGVTYHAGYPAVVLWLSDRLEIIHGDKVTQGSNAHAYLTGSRSSVIFAHSHRREWAEQTRDSRNGPRTIMAANPGCLCRIDGVVPGVKGGTDVFGQPIPSWDNWQQGIAVVTYEPGEGPFVYEPVCIHYGTAFWRGVRYDAGCDVNGLSGQQSDADRRAA